MAERQNLFARTMEERNRQNADYLKTNNETIKEPAKVVEPQNQEEPIPVIKQVESTPVMKVEVEKKAPVQKESKKEVKVVKDEELLFSSYLTVDNVQKLETLSFQENVPAREIFIRILKKANKVKPLSYAEAKLEITKNKNDKLKKGYKIPTSLKVEMSERARANMMKDVDYINYAIRIF